MADEKPQAAPQPAQPVSGMALYYASVFNLATASNDCYLSFASPRPVPNPGGDPPVLQTLEFSHTVVMSPQSLKQLAELLTRNIAAYEERFGPIKIEPLPPMKKHMAKAAKAAKAAGKRKER